MLTCDFATTWAEDTSFLIGDFSSSLVIKRRTVTYDSASVATSSWANVSTGFTRAMQHPLSKTTIRQLAAMQILATDGFMCMPSADIVEADRIYPTSTTTVDYQEAHYKVVSVTLHTGHLSVNTDKVSGLK